MLEQLPILAAVLAEQLMLENQLMIAAALVAVTAALMGMGVPGTLVPISFSSGVLLGGWLGMAVVAAGALIGSQLLFAVTRRWLSDRVRSRWGERLERFDREISKRGFVYLVGLRLAGAPHPIVTAASAVSSLPARSFALATLIGVLPTIVLAAVAGSAV